MFLPSALTSIEPGATHSVFPWVFAETRPPPVPWLATSPDGWLMKCDPLIATFFPSNLTVVVPSFRRSPDVPRFGSGVGTKGAGGPGILQTFGTVASALPPLPSVTGVLGVLTEMVLMHFPSGGRIDSFEPPSAPQSGA